MTMTYGLSCRLYNIILHNRIILKTSQSFCHLMKRVPSRNFLQDYSNREHEEKYGEIKSRLAKIPCLKMLDWEVENVLNELCFENDHRLEEILTWLSKVFNYNVRSGRMIRSNLFLKAYCTYKFSLDDNDWDQWKSEGWKSAVILSWCVELLHAHIIMIDDLMDQSLLRRGEPCWYQKPEVGLSAVNDSILLQCGIYKLLQKHFEASKCYLNFFHEFQKATLNVSYGQAVDKIFSKNSEIEWKKLTFENYKILVDYKATNYSYCLPINLAMHLAGGYSKKDFDLAKEVCLKLGLYGQSQDDRLDFYGPKMLNGMIGNDIREGRLTWFAIKFIEDASEESKKEFLENYGINSEEAIGKVLELYRKAHLLEKHDEFIDLLFKQISSLIESTFDFKGALYYDLFHEVQNRKINV